MHATDVIAYARDGAIICPDCITEPDAVETSAIFAEHEDETIGATCEGGCGACYTPDGWTLHEDAVDRTQYRWSRCAACNSQRPWSIGTSDYTDARLASLRGRHICTWCHRPAVHF